MEHPKDIGDRSTLAIMAALRERGYLILVPFGENSRYDIVIDDGRRLARVQCKTGRLRNGAVRFSARSVSAHHRRPSTVRDYLGQIDFWGVYCPETSGVHLIPIDEAPLRAAGSPRVDPPRNNQQRFIRLAAQYEIGRVQLERGQAETAADRVPGGAAAGSSTTKVAPAPGDERTSSLPPIRSTSARAM